MALSSSDKTLLGGAALLAIASAAVFASMMWRHAAAVPPPLARVELAQGAYVPSAPDAVTLKTETWAAPGAQSRGREWIYDTFTPPEIFYNARSRQFTVLPPSSLMDEDSIEPFGLELISVRPEPFRLQLIGYVGTEGNWRGTFQNVVTGEVFLAASGHAVPKLGLTIKALDVKAQSITLPESMTTQQRVATAVVTDEKNGREVILTHRERHFTGTVFGFVTVSGQTAAREVRDGDTFVVGEATYRVEKIQLTPPSAEITKEFGTLTQPERRVLVAEEPEAPENAEARSPRPGL